MNDSQAGNIVQDRPFSKNVLWQNLLIAFLGLLLSLLITFLAPYFPWITPERIATFLQEVAIGLCFFLLVYAFLKLCLYVWRA